MTHINPKLLHVPKHRLDKMVGATLSDGLRQQYGRRSTRVIKGDSVRVVRGEYKGVEGKVERVNVKSGTLIIEGIQHDKVKGGQVKVPIHASNVLVTGLKTDDKLRFAQVAPKTQSTATPPAQKKSSSKPNSKSIARSKSSQVEKKVKKAKKKSKGASK